MYEYWRLTFVARGVRAPFFLFPFIFYLFPWLRRCRFRRRPGGRHRAGDEGDGRAGQVDGGSAGGVHEREGRTALQRQHPARLPAAQRLSGQAAGDMGRYCARAGALAAVFCVMVNCRPFWAVTVIGWPGLTNLPSSGS